MLQILFLVMLTVASTVASASDIRAQVASNIPVGQFFTIPIDHFNLSDIRTYQNRFWFNDTFYQKGGPIFMYDVGEAGLSDGQAASIVVGSTQVTSNVIELARKYHGIAIAWEHRFYGESLPFPVNNETGFPLAGYDAFKYLNNEQALEDAVYFARNFKLPGQKEDLTSKSTPWIWVGGSYAGARAAMIRVRNPETFFASWSSSGPVESIVGSSVYFNPILQVIPHNCSADINAALNYADHILSQGTLSQVALVRRALFLANSASPAGDRSFPQNSSDDMSYWNMGQILSYPFQGSFLAFQSFGYNLALGSFCNNIEQWNPKNFTQFTMTSPSSVLANNSEDAQFTAAGVAATYGPEAAFYSYLHAIIQKGIADKAFFPGTPRSPIDNASWFWQLCTEFGQWQVSEPTDKVRLLSSFINVTSTEYNDCYKSYPYAPEYPDRVILKYGGWNIQPSNVMFSNGDIDPWRTLSVHSTTKINPAAPNRPSTTKVPKCNTPPQGNTIFGQVYPDAVHVQDFTINPSIPSNVTTPYRLGMALFENALDEWLPCFGRTKRGMSHDALK
jgi:hypothetical protein